VQTTLLGLAIATIVAIVAALAAPLVVHWDHYRGAFEAEASRLTGMDVRIDGPIDARLLPTPRITLRDVSIGRASRKPDIRAASIELEVALGPLLRGAIEATEAHVVAPQIALRLDRSGAIEWPAPSPPFRPEQFAVSRLSVEDGRITLADSASGTQLELHSVSFDGDVRSLAGPFAGEGSLTFGQEPVHYRISGSRDDSASGLKIRLGVDPANRPLTSQFEGLLTVAAGVPQVDGRFVVARPVGAALANGQRVVSDPWHATGAIRLTPASAAIKELTVQYGPDERPIDFSGNAELTFGAKPHFSAALNAVAADIDRAMAAPDVTHQPPLMLVKDFGENFLVAAKLPLPGTLSIGIDGLTLGGTDIESLHGMVRFADNGWWFDDFALRAPGFTDIGFSGHLTQTKQGFDFEGPATLHSAEADVLLRWLSGSSGPPQAQSGELSASGTITMSGNRAAVDRLAVQLGGESVSGRVSYVWPRAATPAVVDADLHATKLDLDALADFAKGAIDQDRFELPRAGTLALDIGNATVAGVAAESVKAQLKFDAGALQIDRLAIAALGGAALNVSGRIDELSSHPRGSLAVDLDAASLAGVAQMVGRFKPQAGRVLEQAATRLAPAKLHGVLGIARAGGDDSSAQFKLGGQLGLMRLAFTGQATGAAVHPVDARIQIDGKLDADDGTALTGLLGLDRAVAVDQLPAVMTLTAAGPLNGELRVDGKIDASGFNGAARGTLRLRGADGPSGTLQVLVSAGDLGPLQRAMTGQAGAAVSVTAHSSVQISGTELAFTQIKAKAGASSLHGRLAFGLATPVTVGGEIAADTADVAHVAALLLGTPSAPAAGAETWSRDPIGAGAFKSLQGAVTVKVDHALVASMAAIEGFGGVIRFDGPAITFEQIHGAPAGGRLDGNLAFRRNADGLVARSRVAVDGADAATLFHVANSVIDARLSIHAETEGIGATAAALVAALHGGGDVTLSDGRLGGLNPGAFSAALQSVNASGEVDRPKLLAAVSDALGQGPSSVSGGTATFVVAGGKAAIHSFAL